MVAGKTVAAGGPSARRGRLLRAGPRRRKRDNNRLSTFPKGNADSRSTFNNLTGFRESAQHLDTLETPEYLLP